MSHGNARLIVHGRLLTAGASAGWKQAHIASPDMRRGTSAFGFAMVLFGAAVLPCLQGAVVVAARSASGLKRPLNVTAVATHARPVRGSR